jgi:hypothetical protein
MIDVLGQSQMLKQRDNIKWHLVRGKHGNKLFEMIISIDRC